VLYGASMWDKPAQQWLDRNSPALARAILWR
jgi:hypothetical protein